MEDYRGEICLLDGKYLAKCIGQDFYYEELTFEVSPGGLTFVRKGDLGVEIVNDKQKSFDEIKHLLPRINDEN